MTDASRPVFTRFVATDTENRMTLYVDDKRRTIKLVEDTDEGQITTTMTPHRARAIGERLIEMADGLVKAEKDE